MKADGRAHCSTLGDGYGIWKGHTGRHGADGLQEKVEIYGCKGGMCCEKLTSFTDTESESLCRDWMATGLKDGTLDLSADAEYWE